MSPEEIRDWLRKPETIAGVLRHIGEVAGNQPLPKGIIAGGAVANTLHNLLHGTSAAIRDIDVYSHQPWTDKNKKELIEPKQHIPTFPSKLLNPHDYLFWEMLYKGKPNIWVGKHTRNGVFNNIVLHSRAYQCDPLEYDAPFSPEQLISTFDLNCTQAAIVAVRNDKQEILVTDAFVQFLADRVVQVTSIRSPCATAVRYFDKKEQLQAEGNDDKEMRLLSQLQLASANAATPELDELRCGYLPWSPATHAAKLTRHKSAIENYFEILPGNQPEWFRLKPKCATLDPTFRALVSQGPRAAQIAIALSRAPARAQEAAAALIERQANKNTTYCLLAAFSRQPEEAARYADSITNPFRLRILLQQLKDSDLRTFDLAGMPELSLENLKPAVRLNFFKEALNDGDLFETPLETLLPYYQEITDLVKPRTENKGPLAVLLKKWLKSFAQAKIKSSVNSNRRTENQVR